jgi:hypothetical protein
MSSTAKSNCAKIFGDLSEFVESGTIFTSERSSGLLKAVAKMIVDEYGLSAFQCLDHRVHLLGNLKAAPAALDHGDGGGEMTVRPLQAVDHIRVRVMRHGSYAIPLEGIHQRYSGAGLAAAPLPSTRNRRHLRSVKPLRNIGIHRTLPPELDSSSLPAKAGVLSQLGSR